MHAADERQHPFPHIPSPRPPSPAEVVHVVGNLDHAGLDDLRDRCIAELGRGAGTLTLDFTAMTDCTTALFPLLSALNRTVRSQAAQLRILGLVEAVGAVVADRAGSPAH